jgi:hypothetical protein
MHEQHALRHMTAEALAHLGLEDVAYIKPVTLEDGQAAFAIHAADGQQMAVMADREVAFATVRQNDMEPVSVH